MQTPQSHSATDGATVCRPPIHARTFAAREEPVIEPDITMDDMVKIIRKLSSELLETRANLAALTSRVNFQDQVITSLRSELSGGNTEEELEPIDDNNRYLFSGMPVRCITGDF